MSMRDILNKLIPIPDPPTKEETARRQEEVRDRILDQLMDKSRPRRFVKDTSKNTRN